MNKNSKKSVNYKKIKKNNLKKRSHKNKLQDIPNKPKITKSPTIINKKLNKNIDRPSLSLRSVQSAHLSGSHRQKRRHTHRNSWNGDVLKNKFLPNKPQLKGKYKVNKPKDNNKSKKISIIMKHKEKDISDKNIKRTLNKINKKSNNQMIKELELKGVTISDKSNKYLKDIYLFSLLDNITIKKEK